MPRNRSIVRTITTDSTHADALESIGFCASVVDFARILVETKKAAPHVGSVVTFMQWIAKRAGSVQDAQTAKPQDPLHDDETQNHLDRHNTTSGPAGSLSVLALVG
jgi:hypothetical protein